jgi:hypothetical protein
MQWKRRLRYCRKDAHQSTEEALLGSRLKILAIFMIGSCEKDSQRFILAERHKLPVAAREGHRNSHDR